MGEAGAMKCGSPGAVTVSRRLAKAIPELRRLQNLLISGEDLDPRILTDFRDALNHVRNTAWSAHQYIASKSIDHDSTSVLSVLVSRRTYSRCLPALPSHTSRFEEHRY